MCRTAEWMQPLKRVALLFTRRRILFNERIWMMKILICGKGGSGKSTIAALLSKNLVSRGFEVLLIDADESNLGLHRLTGVSMPMDIMEDLGGKKGFKEKLNKTFPDNDQPFSKKIKISELPEACIGEGRGIKLAAIGKIHDFGEGCACPPRCRLPGVH